MVLPIVQYGHPTLRKKGARIETVTDDIHRLIADMFETMEKADGVGLAAPQVDHALQLALVDVRGVSERPSLLWLNGHRADVDSFMPLVLINPVVVPYGPKAKGMEGCLSFPDVYAEVERQAEVEVTAWNERGEEYSFRAGGLLARAVLHEVDHLNGVLFIDRMNSEARAEIKPDVDRILASTKARLKRG